MAFASVLGGKKTNWYERDNDYYSFLENLEDGDLVEFHRGIYQHWAVYVGYQDFSDYESEPSVIHRMNQEGTAYFSSLMRKIDKDKGDINLEPLEGVWRQSQARVSNIFDNVITPYEPNEVVERAKYRMRASRTDKEGDGYNLSSNNCEHFVNWCRYGFGLSTQVLTVGAVVAGTAMLGITFLSGKLLGNSDKSDEHKY